MRRTFFAGLAILLPIAITLFIVTFFVDFLTAPFVGLVEDFLTQKGTTELAQHHRYILVFLSRLIILIALFFLILLLGFLGRKIAFSWFINMTHRIFYKIPIIKTIYKATREISTEIFSDKQKKLFKGTVSVPFPSQKTRALALLSGDPPQEVQDKEYSLQSVFIPTAPHPISGFLIMYNKEDIQKTDISTEDLFKFLLSCGLSHPKEKNQ